MDAELAERSSARIAAAIGEPARAQMLYCLMDDHARTATELAVVAGVSPSTASAHLDRLKREQLVTMRVVGKHRYFSLAGPEVAGVLEALNVLAGGARQKFTPSTPNALRGARTCYDHIAGTLGVTLHDGLMASGWMTPQYQLSEEGVRGMVKMGLNVDAAHRSRRRFAYGCLDWSERRSHLGGALGAAVLQLALEKRWVAQEMNSRALRVTASGQRELLRRWNATAPLF